MWISQQEILLGFCVNVFQMLVWRCTAVNTVLYIGTTKERSSKHYDASIVADHGISVSKLIPPLFKRQELWGIRVCENPFFAVSAML